MGQQGECSVRHSGLCNLSGGLTVRRCLFALSHGFVRRWIYAISTIKEKCVTYHRTIPIKVSTVLKHV
jgi:hypothetical protein